MSHDPQSRIGSSADAVNASLRESFKLLEAVFPPDTRIGALTVNDNDGRSKGLAHYFTLDEYLDRHAQLVRLNDAGRHVYVGVNPRDREDWNGSNVSEAYACVVDLDKCDPQQLIDLCEEHLGQRPTVTVASGGGGQAWLVLDAPIPIARWERIQRALVATIPGADATIKDPARAMRMPGFYNPKTKYAPDYPLATIIDFDPERIFSADDLPHADEEAISDSAEIAQSPHLEIPTGYLSEAAKRFIATGELYPVSGNAEPSRRMSLFKLACECKADKRDLEESLEMILEVALGLGLTAEELEDIPRQVENAFAKERSPRVAAEDAPKVKLPKSSGKPVAKFTAEGEKVRVRVRVGAQVQTGCFDPGSDNARKIFLRDLRKRFDDVDFAEVESQLHAIAAGDLQPEEPPPPPPEPAPTAAEEVDEGSTIRPEAWNVSHGETICTGFTIPVRVLREGSVVGEWMSYIRKGDSREAIRLPEQIQIDDAVFHIVPESGPPPTEFTRTWSKESRWRWIESGRDEMPPAELFAKLVEAISSFVEYDQGVSGPHMPELLATWAIATYAKSSFGIFPYLSFSGAYGSGKSRSVEILTELVFRPMYVVDVSPAVLFRDCDALGVTLFVDEAERIHGAEEGMFGDLRSIFLSGYKRGGSVRRCVGDDHTPTPFRVDGFKSLASKKEPDDTLGSRCIHTTLMKCSSDSPLIHRKPDDEAFADMWQELRDALHVWAINRGAWLLTLPPAEAVTPKHLAPRTAEIWGTLFRLASLLESEGVAGLSDKLERLATFKQAAAESIAVSDLHLAVLTAAVKLAREYRKTGDKRDIPSAGKIATIASQDSGLQIFAERIAGVLSEYGFLSRRLDGRKVFEIPEELIRVVEERHGLTLSPKSASDKGAAPAPEVVTSVTSVTSATSSRDAPEPQPPPEVTTSPTSVTSTTPNRAKKHRGSGLSGLSGPFQTGSATSCVTATASATASSDEPAGSPLSEVATSPTSPTSGAVEKSSPKPRKRSAKTPTAEQAEGEVTL